MNNNTANNADHTLKTIEGKIKNLAIALTKLAPHPDRSHHHGPLFVSLNSAFKPAANYDGMLGGIMLEGALSEAFSGAIANDNIGVAATYAADHKLFDALCEYMEERGDASTHNNHGRGRGSIALYERKLISQNFNDAVDPAMDAYLQDLPERLQIERAIAELQLERDGYLRHINSEPQIYAVA